MGSDARGHGWERVTGTEAAGLSADGRKVGIVKLTLEPGTSVASVAQANGLNANQAFRWKRQYERGELQPRRSKAATALVPVIAAEPEAAKTPRTSE